MENIVNRLYYSDNQTQIFAGDCRNLLSRFSRSLAVISDPPYGIKANFNRDGRRSKTKLSGKPLFFSTKREQILGDDQKFDPAHLLDFKYLALFGANHFADKLPACSKWLVWDKRCGTTSDSNSDCELIWTNLEGAARFYSHLWRGIVREGRENLSHGAKLHPAQKPVALMKWVILQMNVPLDVTILDPYCGSGSTLVAAKELGYKAIGIEAVEEYCQISAQRLNQQCFQLSYNR